MNDAQPWLGLVLPSLPLRTRTPGSRHWMRPFIPPCWASTCFRPIAARARLLQTLHVLQRLLNCMIRPLPLPPAPRRQPRQMLLNLLLPA
jgi:hypothetical protein